MADLTLRMLVETATAEQALARLRQLVESATGAIATEAARATAAIGSLGDAYQRNAARFADTLRVQEQMRDTLQQVSQAYTQGAQAYQQNATAFQRANQTISASLRQTTAEIGRGLDQVVDGLQDIGNGAKTMLEGLGPSFTKASLILGAFGGALTAPFVLGVHAAAEFESSMVGLRRTLGAFGEAGPEVEENFQGIAQGIRDIASVSGMATDQLAGIAEQAARLGLKGEEDVLAFTDAVQKVSQVTHIAGPAVARDMANLAKAMDFPIDQMERLGSAIVEVGRITQASDQEILGLSQILTGAARTAGLSTEQLLALSAAISSTGGASFLAGQAFNILLTRMTQAVQEGDDLLDVFAKVTHLVDQQITTAEAFAELFRADPMRAVTEFFQGLNASGEKAVVVLDRLGLSGGRVARAFLQFAQQAGQIPAIQERVNKAIQDGTALQEQYNNVQATFEEILKDVEQAAKAALVETFQRALPVLKPAANALLEIINTARDFPVINQLTAAVATLTGGVALLGSSLGLTAKGLLETTASFGTIISGFRDAKALAGIETIGEGFAKIARGARIAITAVADLSLALLAFAATPQGLILIGLAAIATGLVILDQKTGIVTETTKAAAKATEDWIQRSVRGMEEELAPAAEATDKVLDGFFSSIADWLHIADIDAWIKRQVPAIEQFGQWLSRTFPGQAKDGAEAVSSGWIDAMQGMGEAVEKAKPLFEDFSQTAKKTGQDLDVDGKETMKRRAAEAKRLLEDLQTFQIKANADLDLALTTGTLSEQEAIVKRMALLDKASAEQKKAFDLNMANARQEGKEAVATVQAAYNQQLAQTDAARKQLIGQSEKSFRAALDAELKAQADLTDELAKLYESDYQAFARTQDAKLRDQLQTTLKTARLSGQATSALEGTFRQSPFAADQIAMFKAALANLQAIGEVSDQDAQKFRKFIDQAQTLTDVWLTQSDAVNKLRVGWEEARATAGVFGAALDKQNAAFAIGQRRYEDLTDAEKALADTRAYSLGQQRLYSAETELLSKDIDQAALALKAETDAIGLWGAEAEKAILVAERSRGRLTLQTLTPETRQKVDKMFDDQAQTTLLKAMRDVNEQLAAEEAAFGKAGLAADVQRYAITNLHRAYENLDPLLKAEITLIVSRTRLAQEEAAANAMVAASHGEITKAIGMEIAARARAIDEVEAQQEATIAALEKINGAQQRQAINTAKIQQGIAEGHGDMLAYMGATTRLWVAQQPTIWQGFATMMTNTFDNLSRTLSDVFFNVFTGETVKLKDVWKSMLNAMLRELSNFLASSTLKFFLGFLGNMMQGQGVGQAAGGALGGLLGGTGSTGGAAGTATGTGSLLLGLAKMLGINTGGEATAAAPPISAATSGVTGPTLGANTQLQSPLAGFSLPSLSAPSGGSSGFSLFSSPTADYTMDFSSLGGTGFNMADVTTEYFAAGGSVPGHGTGDTVPAMLTPGEFVVRREVADAIRPVLVALNASPGPALREGRLHFATGGVVPSIGSFQTAGGDPAVINLLYALYQQSLLQTAAAQATVTNTQGTADALADATGQFVPTAGVTSISGTGANVSPITTVAGPSSGSAGTAGATGGASATGSPSVFDTTLAQIGGATGLLRTGTNLLGLGAKALPSGTVSPGFGQTLSGINNALGLITGGVNLASGISRGNVLQSVGGGLQLAGGTAGLATQAGLLSSTTGSLIGGGLGAVGSGLGLYSSIQGMVQNGASAQGVISALLNAYGVYAGAATVLNATGVASLPTIGSALAGLTGTVAGTAAPGLTAATTAGVTGGELALGAAAETGAAAAGGTIGGSIAATYATVFAPVIVGYLANAIGEMVVRGQAMKQAIARYEGLARAVPEYLTGMQALGTASTAFDPAVVTPAQAAELYKLIGDFTNAYRQNGVEDFIKSGTTVGAGSYKDVQIDFPQGEQIEAALEPIRQQIRLGAIRALDVLGRAGIAPPPVPAGSGFYTDPVELAMSQIPNVQGVFAGGGGPIGHGMLIPGYTLMPSFVSNSQGNTLNISSSLLAAIRGLPPGGLESGIAQLTAAAQTGQFTPANQPQVAEAVRIGTTMSQSQGTGGDAYLQAWNDAIAQQMALQQQGVPIGEIQFPFETAAMAQQTAYEAFTSGGMQAGGWVPGQGPGDHVPMLLEPGEFVVPREPAQRFGPVLAALLGHGAASEDDPGQVADAMLATLSRPQAPEAPRTPTGGAFSPVVAPRGAMIPYTPWRESAQGRDTTVPSFGAQMAASMPVSISITVNGNVDDPEALARVLAPKLRDELRRIEPRYSRAGNKSQG